MKLLIGGDIFHTQSRGGISTIYRQILPRLHVLHPEIEFTIGVQGGIRTEEFEQLLPFCRSIPEMKRTLRPWRLFSRIAPIVNNRHVRQFTKGHRHDVYHPTYYRNGAPNVPSFCYVHDMTLELCPEMFDHRYSAHWIARKKKVITEATLVLCVSESTRRDVVRLTGVPESKCRLSYHGPCIADLNSYPSDCSGLPKRFLLYVGDYVNAYKRFDFFLEALGSSKSDLLGDAAIVAVSPLEPSEDAMARFRSLLRSDRLLFLSHCSDAQLSMLYGACLALVYPSAYEGFGIPVLDALAHGTPVVCSNSSSLPEVGGDAVYYFEGDSHAGFSSALDKALRDGRGGACVERRRRQAGKFSWDQAAELFAEACVDCL